MDGLSPSQPSISILFSANSVQAFLQPASLFMNKSQEILMSHFPRDDYPHFQDFKGRACPLAEP